MGFISVINKRGYNINIIICGGGRKKEGEISKLNFFLLWYLFKVDK